MQNRSKISSPCEVSNVHDLLVKSVPYGYGYYEVPSSNIETVRNVYRQTVFV